MDSVTGARSDWGEAASQNLQVPVIDAAGRYEIRDLPAGTYRVRVRNFDFGAYVSTFNGPEVTIPEGKTAAEKLDVEVEAKELRYGKVLYSDGTPLAKGSYFLRLGRQNGRFANGIAKSLGADGTFRIALSKEERQQFIEAAAGLIEIQCLANNQKHEVYLGELSKDPTHPTVFITEIAPPAKSK